MYYAPINGLPQDRGVGATHGIRLDLELEFDILNVPRMGNLTQPPSWKVEDREMSDRWSLMGGGRLREVVPHAGSSIVTTCTLTGRNSIFYFSQYGKLDSPNL